MCCAATKRRWVAVEDSIAPWEQKTIPQPVICRGLYFTSEHSHHGSKSGLASGKTSFALLAGVNPNSDAMRIIVSA
jgi:hypothetical protein